MVARQAHNLEVACSSPASATPKPDFRAFFVLLRLDASHAPGRSSLQAKRCKQRLRVLPPQLTRTLRRSFFVAEDKLLTCNRSQFYAKQSIVSLPTGKKKKKRELFKHAFLLKVIKSLLHFAHYFLKILLSSPNGVAHSTVPRTNSLFYTVLRVVK